MENTELIRLQEKIDSLNYEIGKKDEDIRNLTRKNEEYDVITGQLIWFLYCKQQIYREIEFYESADQIRDLLNKYINKASWKRLGDLYYGSVQSEQNTG